MSGNNGAGRGGGGGAAGDEYWDGPEPAELAFSVFPSDDDDTDEELSRAPGARKRRGGRRGGSRGSSASGKGERATGITAVADSARSSPSTIATAAAAAAPPVGTGGLGDDIGGRVGDGRSNGDDDDGVGGVGVGDGDGRSESEGGDDTLECLGGRRDEEKGEEEEEKEEGGDDEGGIVWDDYSSATDATSALPAGDTDIDEDPPVNTEALETARSGNEDGENEGGIAKAESAAGPAAAGDEREKAVSGCEGDGGATAAAAADAEEAPGGDGHMGEEGPEEEEEEEEEEGSKVGREDSSLPETGQCPICQKNIPLKEVENHVNACLDMEDVQVIENPARETAGEANGNDGNHGSDLSGGSAQGGRSGSAYRKGGGSAGGSAGGSGAGQEEERQECFVCNKLFAVAELELHVNMCLDKQALEVEEKEKREDRARRKNRCVLSRYVPPSAKAEAGESKKPRGIAIGTGAGSAADARSSDTEAKPRVKSLPTAAAAAAAAAASTNGKRKVRGDEKSAKVEGDEATDSSRGAGPAPARRKMATGKGKAKQREQQVKKKEGKGKGKPMPSAAARQGFECPKKLKGYQAGGCGQMNEESSQRCRRCNLRLWAWRRPSGEERDSEPGGGGGGGGGEGASVRLAKRVRLGDPVKWPEKPHLGRPGEVKIQVGFVHSLHDEVPDERSRSNPLAAAAAAAASTGAASGASSDAAAAEGIITACCSYKNFKGYLSAATRLENLQLLAPPPPPITPIPTPLPGDGSISSGGSVSNGSHGIGGGGSLTGALLGSSKCRHVEARAEPNYKSGKCYACHKAHKRRAEMKGGGGDLMGGGEEEEEEEEIVDDDTVQCETPGCSKGQFQLGVCTSCFARHRKRIAVIRTAAKKARELQDKNPPPCRACEGLLSDSNHAACMARVNAETAENGEALLQSLDDSITGRCTECGVIGGKGAGDQLLLCDGMDCPNATHMRCLPFRLTEVPRRLWYCTECCRNGNNVKSARGCEACGSTDNDEKILLCDGPGCNSTPYHYDCLPVPLEGVPADNSDWFCPRCAHGESAPNPTASSSACGSGGSSDGGGGKGGGSGGTGGDGRSHGARASRQGSSSSSMTGRGGGGAAGKRKRGSSNSNSSGSSGPNGAVTSAKRAGSPASCLDGKNGGFSPPPDLCAHPVCLVGCTSRPRVTSDGNTEGGLNGVAVSGGIGVITLPSLATVSASAGTGEGGGDAAAGHGLVEALAQKEVERRRCQVLAQDEADRGRWRCKSEKCREIHNSYHRMCLETRLIKPAAEAAAGAPNHGGEDQGLGRSADLLCPVCCGVVATHQQVALAQQGILRYRTFKAALIRSIYAEFGKPRSEVEKDRGLGFKGSVMIKGKSAYMYGSICEGAVDFIFRTVGLTSEDCFLDIGSGLGQIVMQAAAWAGCRSLGVEVVKERHDAAERLLKRIVHEAAGTAAENVDKAELTWGDFVHKWDLLKDCTVIYLNNENRWFKARNDPDKAKYSYESKLVGLLQEQERSITLVTMEQIHPRPQGWTHEEHIYGTLNGEKRVATFASGSLKIHFYKTNSGSWQCSFCDERHAKTVTECSCPSNRRTDLRPRKGASSGHGTSLAPA